MDTKNRKDIFDENFEVTYEEEFPEIPVDDQKTASLILMFLITCLMAYKFWTNHSTYGAIATVVSDRNYILGAYVAVALVLLLFEIISFLWATSGPRVSNRQGRSFKSDTGRGMFSFILICTGSFAAKILFFMVPETPAPLICVRGALMVYGSMFDLLFKLGIAGIISCILRKIFSR